jgi:hypothetical protein
MRGVGASGIERRLAQIEHRQLDLQRRQAALIRQPREASVEAFLEGVADVLAEHHQIGAELRLLGIDPAPSRFHDALEYVDLSLLS